MDNEEPVLTDAELRLRPLKLPDDISAASTWYRDPEVMFYAEGDKDAVYDAATIEQMYRCLAAQGELYIIERWDGARWEPIGDVTLAPDTMPITIGVAEFRSRGYGKRVIQLLVERARSLGWKQLKVKSVYTYNLRSKRLFESTGFKQVGDTPLNAGEDLPCWRFVKQL